MLARSSILRHESSGVDLQTPLLIPSFSSKGFARHKEDNKSEIRDILSAASEFITETYLISAYDIHHEHLPAARELPFLPEMIFLDSGGYEVSTDRDYSSVIDPLPCPESWDLGKWQSVVSSWPEEVPMVAVSYDHHEERVPFAEQVASARKRFRSCHSHLHSILLKPETKSQTTLAKVLPRARAEAADLGKFDIIGVTEKELGRSMLDRMEQIAQLRLALNDAQVGAPIHVFGALDPLSICLYFISGAEIFDGLTWIRYGYDDGRCVYLHNFGMTRYGLHTKDNSVKARALADNCYFLQELQLRLREFEQTGKFAKLKPHADLLRNAYDKLSTRFPKGRL